MNLKDSISFNLLNKKIDSINHTIDLIETEINKPENSEMYGISISIIKVFVAVFVPIILFGLGNFISWYKKKSEKKKKIESKIKTLSSWVYLMKKPLELQISSNNKYSSTIKNSKIIHPAEIHFYDLLAEKLQDFTLSDYVDFLVLNLNGNQDEKDKNLFNIISQINFLIKVEIKLRETYENQKNEIIDLMSQWNNKLKEIDVILMNDKEDSVTDSSLFNYANEQQLFLKDSYPNNFLELEIIINNYFTPVLKYAKKSMKNIYASRLIIILTEIMFISKQYDKHKNGYSFLINDISEQMNISYTKLKETVDNINSRKINRVWQIT